MSLQENARSFVRRFGIVAALLLATGGTAAAMPAIEVTSSGLRATGLTPGAEAVWFGASIGTYNSTRLLQRHAQVVADTDRDGVVELSMPVISRFLVATVVDLSSGAVAVHEGAGVRGVELDLRGGQWRAALEHFDIPAELLEILLVRPGTGAWTARGAEGGALDGDQSRNRAFRLKVKEMEPLTGSAKPHGGVRRGDVIVIIDARSLAYVIRTAAE